MVRRPVGVWQSERLRQVATFLGVLDVAFAVNAAGRLDFARNGSGDYYLDDRGVYAVLGTLFANKGEYAFDGDVGTFLARVTKDGRTTGTRIASCCDDMAQQLRDDQIIRSASSRADRLRDGAWQITIEWVTASGQRQKETLKL